MDKQLEPFWGTEFSFHPSMLQQKWGEKEKELVICDGAMHAHHTSTHLLGP